jgi:hypothetical protein
MSNLSTWRKLLVFGTAVILFACEKEDNRGGAGRTAGTLGVYLAGIYSGVCTSITTGGTYTPGVSLTSANTVTVQVTVTTPGTFTISTNTVNGISFSNSGTFSATGFQNVILTGTGTPINSGSQNFAVSFGSSTCNFSITFATGTTATDYFPTTMNSYWAYKLHDGGFSDTFFIKVIPYTLSAGGNNYSTFYTPDFLALHSPDSLYYRKPGGDYIEYINTAESFGLDGPNVENIFLKDNVPQGTTWNSPDITGTYNGISYTFFIKMTLFEKITTPTTIGVVTSSDILKVRYEYFNTVAPGTPALIEERWFAKGIGMIYNSLTYRTTGTATNTDIYHVARYQVF